MQSRKPPSDAASDRRQRLQFGGGALAVALIWTLALWPSGDDTERQSGPLPAVSPSPWTTGSFMGTTQTTPGATTSATPSTTSPTGAATAPRLPGTTYTAPPAGPVAPAPTTSPKVTRTTAEERTPPGLVNKTTRPPKALSLTDVDVLGTS